MESTDEPPREAHFRTLFDAHFQDVTAYARRRSQSQEDADDAVAETFTIAWRRIDDLPRGSELPWLYGVARRVLANQRRGQRRWLSLLDRIRQQPADVPTSEFSGTSPVIAALAQLKPADQEVLRLTAWEDLDHAQVAVVLGITTNAATIRLHRARRRLAEKLTAMQAANRNEPVPAGHITG